MTVEELLHVLEMQNVAREKAERVVAIQQVRLDLSDHIIQGLKTERDQWKAEALLGGLAARSAR